MTTSLIEFQAVTKRFRNSERRRGLWKRLFSSETRVDKVIFSNLNLTIREAEKIVVVGDNGAGKTTLLKLAGGFILPNAGDIQVAGRPSKRIDRSDIGLMLSTQLLYPNLTGYQNLEYSAYLFNCPDPSSSINHALSLWGLQSIADQLVESYSNGRRALLALARATLHHPRILLLDEPEAYLDETNRQKLLAYLKDSRQTVLITTQDPTLYHDVTDRTVKL